MIPLIDRYRSYLEDTVPRELEHPVSLGEGGTPLVRLRRLERRLSTRGVALFAKVEGQNPTGSFKDRGMTVAVSVAAHRGARALVCASTGNTAASAAAYGARAGLRVLVVLPAKAVATGKLAQAIACGAVAAEVEAGFDRALEVVRELAKHPGVELVNSVNPARLEGQKTAAFEVCDDLGDAPGFLAIPVGNAGNITAYWRGFRQYHQAGRATRRPAMLGFQAAGAAPIVRGVPVDRPETVASAIRIGNPASWRGAVAARDESQGLIAAVDDEAIVAAQRLLAEEEGVFCEPASAASVAGILKLAGEGYFATRSGTAVCVLTGSGLKDPDAARRMERPQQVHRVAASVDALAALLSVAQPAEAPRGEDAT